MIILKLPCLRAIYDNFITDSGYLLVIHIYCLNRWYLTVLDLVKYKNLDLKVLLQYTYKLTFILYNCGKVVKAVSVICYILINTTIIIIINILLNESRLVSYS